MSKTACGDGKLYSAMLSYSPVPGLRKSGIPHATHIHIHITKSSRHQPWVVLIYAKLNLSGKLLIILWLIPHRHTPPTAEQPPRRLVVLLPRALTPPPPLPRLPLPRLRGTTSNVRIDNCATRNVLTSGAASWRQTVLIPVSYGGWLTNCLAAAVYLRALLSTSKRLVSLSLRKLPAYD